MAFDGNKPADTEFIAEGPGVVRENLRALKDDRIVDAGKLKGLVPGHASGQIPLSDGTVCVGLNADKLDGKNAGDFAADGHPHSNATTASAGFMSGSDKTKLDGIATGAEVNQAAFANVKVGGTTLQADAKSDTLELVAGTNIALTPDASGDKVTVGLTGKVAAATSADDADTVGGIDPSQFYRRLLQKPSYAIGDSTGPRDGDLAEFTGLRLDFIQGFPLGGSGYRTVLTLRGYSQANGAAQIAFPYNTADQNVYYRYQNYTSAEWSDWFVLWNSGNDGSGSGLDADKLDGQHLSYITDLIAAKVASAEVATSAGANKIPRADSSGKIDSGFLPVTEETAATILAKLLTVDGSGSGLDADKLDGYHASSFLRILASDLAGDDGYIKLSNGLIIQWGSTAITNVDYNTINFPVTFPSICFTLVAGLGVLDTQAIGGWYPVMTRKVTRYSFQAGIYIYNGTTKYVRWVAFGK